MIAVLALLAMTAPASLAAPLQPDATSVTATATPVPRSNPDLDGLHSPMAYRLPWITGTRQVGHVLRCHAGAWKGSAAFTFAYQWKRGSIVVATGRKATYRLRSRDAGSRVRCVVSATNEYGSGRAPSHSVKVRR